MERNASDWHVTVDEVATLARLAGLGVERARLAGLRDEFQVALLAIADLADAAGRLQGSGDDLFDAAWPKDGRP